MQSQAVPGQHLEVLFIHDGRTLDVDTGDVDAGLIADALVEAIGKDDPAEAERLIQVGVGPRGMVQRRQP